MEKTITVTGKNMELATQAAMAQLGMDRDSIQVELVAREKSGFFGIGSSPCIIKAADGSRNFEYMILPVRLHA